MFRVPTDSERVDGYSGLAVVLRQSAEVLSHLAATDPEGPLSEVVELADLLVGLEWEAER